MPKPQIPFQITDKDPSPYSMQKGTGTFLFTGPHNGHAVPRCLIPCLGMPEDWFKTAHEASDLHISTLFEHLMKKEDTASYLWGNYSRLVCDLNCKPEYAISKSSSEYDHIIIPQNQPEYCCQQHASARKEHIYTPYHDAQHNLINDIRNNNNQSAIVIDIHSFTPTWEQQQRHVEIGTIRCEKTPLSRTLETFLKNQDEYHFISGEPYRVEDRPSNAASLITKRNNLQYLGLEIRHDLIATPKNIKKMVNFLSKCTNHLKNHLQYGEISQPRSEITPTTM